LKTWVVLYGLIWAAFFQIIIILFPVFGMNVSIALHVAVGAMVIFFAVYSFVLVNKTECPDRIKRISKTTAILAGVQGVLGVILLVMILYNISGTIQDIVLFLHVVNALAIITQAASSATSYDMWEEREFLTKSPSSASSPTGG
jgi:hypothetical protein